MNDQTACDRPTPAEVREKQRHAELAAQQAGLSQEATGRAYENEARRPSLRDRVGSARHRAERSAEKCAPLQELVYLLDKNPDVARILELLETTGV